MLKLNLTPLFKLRGIRYPYSYMMKLGFSHDVAKRLARNAPTGIQLRHMTKLCEVLNCTPNDLLEYNPKESRVSDQHPLRALNKDRYGDVSLHALNQLPLEKVRQVQEYLQQLERKE